MPGTVISVLQVKMLGEVLTQAYGISPMFSTFLVLYKQAQWH